MSEVTAAAAPVPISAASVAGEGSEAAGAGADLRPSRPRRRAPRRSGCHGCSGSGAAAIGENDSEELRLRKTLLIFASGLMNMAAIVWLAIYWVLGLKLPTTIPLAYQVLSALILVIYLKTRNFDFFRFAQLSLFLFAPFVIQWTIGSFVNSSGIVLLALLAPVGAMVVYGARESIPWFVAYVVLTVLSGVFDYFLAERRPAPACRCARWRCSSC